MERVATSKSTETKTQSRASARRKTADVDPVSTPAEHALFLQRTIGNQAVQKLFKSGAVQAKLKVGAPNDIYEQEANRMAEQVMRMPERTIQTKPG